MTTSRRTMPPRARALRNTEPREGKQHRSASRMLRLSCCMDNSKAMAELDVLREFIDFVNRQVGVYSDCLAGFQGNVVRIERQVARINRPTGRRLENGQPVVMRVSVEDPGSP